MAVVIYVSSTEIGIILVHTSILLIFGARPNESYIFRYLRLHYPYSCVYDRYDMALVHATTCSNFNEKLSENGKFENFVAHSLPLAGFKINCNL